MEKRYCNNYEIKVIHYIKNAVLKLHYPIS